MDAYASNINKCLFVNWKSYKKKQPAVLVQTRKVKCNGKQLCYNRNNDGIAQFAVCYNLKKNIPEFSGHILHPNIRGGGRQDGFRNESSIGNFSFILS